MGATPVPAAGGNAAAAKRLGVLCKLLECIQAGDYMQGKTMQAAATHLGRP